MKDLLNLANEDLKIAVLLLKKKKYTNALYHYHQSVEKTVKFVGLLMGGISENQLDKDIRHNPIKVFKLLLKYFSKESEGMLPITDPHLFTNVKQLIDSGTEESIINNAMLMLKSVYNENYMIQVDDFPTPFDAYCDYLNKGAPENKFNLDNDIFKEYAATQFKELAAKTIIFVNYGSKIFQILLANSLVCSKYRPDNFRYPSEELGNPVDYFNNKNEIVKNLHFFLDSMKFTIKYAPKIDWLNKNS